MIPLERPPVDHALPAAQHALPAEHQVDERRHRLAAHPGVLHPEQQRGLCPDQPRGPRAARARSRDGEAYRQLVAALEAELGALVNPATGAAPARDARHLIDEIFPGPERQHLPDVVDQLGLRCPGPRPGPGARRRAWSAASAATRRRPSTPAITARTRSSWRYGPRGGAPARARRRAHPRPRADDPRQCSASSRPAYFEGRPLAGLV